MSVIPVVRHAAMMTVTDADPQVVAMTATMIDVAVVVDTMTGEAEATMIAIEDTEADGTGTMTTDVPHLEETMMTETTDEMIDTLPLRRLPWLHQPLTKIDTLLEGTIPLLDEEMTGLDIKCRLIKQREYHAFVMATLHFHFVQCHARLSFAIILSQLLPATPSYF